MKRYPLFIFMVWFALASFPVPAHATVGDVPERRTVWVVTAPGLSFLELEASELAAYPHLRRLVGEGSVGAVNIRTQEQGIEDVYLSVAAGSPAVAASEWNAYRGDEWVGEDSERAGHLFYRYTGRLVPSDFVVVPEIMELRARNQSPSFDGAKGGLLGDVMRREGWEVSVYGNRDRGNAQGSAQRHLPLMLMTSEGVVGRGNVGREGWLRQAERPFGIQVNEDQWKEWIRQAEGKTGIRAFEWGDFDRLFAERGRYASDRFARMLSEAMLEFDLMIGDMLRALKKEDVLYVFSPGVHAEARTERKLLAPLVRYEQGAAPGLFRSDTTRRDGVVSMYDIGPSLLADLGVRAPDHMLGVPLTTKATSDALGWLTEEMDRISTVYEARPRILIPFASYAVVVLLGSLAIALTQWRRLNRIVRAMLYSLLAAPAAFLITPLFPYTSVEGLSLWFLSLLILICGGLSRLPARTAVSWIGLGSSALILLDGLGGAAFMKQSVFGYDPMIGARYYGIGNEYMGVLIASAVIGMGFLRFGAASRDRATIWSVGIGFVVILGYLAAPGLGTNAGGALTASAAFGFASYRWFYPSGWRKPSWRMTLLGGFVLIATGLAALWLLNAVLPAGGQSHIGRAMALLQQGRIDLIGEIIGRKLSMNLHLIGVSVWSKVLFAGIIVFVVLILRPSGALKEWMSRRRQESDAIAAVAVGSVAALAFNDSGIVAAAIMFLYIAVPMLIVKHQP